MQKALLFAPITPKICRDRPWPV